MDKQVEAQILQTLGEIKGQVTSISKNQESFDNKLDKFDERLRKQENRTIGIASVATIGMTLMIESVKSAFKVV